MKIFDRLDNYVNDKKFSMIYKNNKLDIINYSKIIEFTSTIISVSYNNKIYQIKGDNLVGKFIMSRFQLLNSALCFI